MSANSVGCLTPPPPAVDKDMKWDGPWGGPLGDSAWDTSHPTVDGHVPYRSGAMPIACWLYLNLYLLARIADFNFVSAASFLLVAYKLVIRRGFFVTEAVIA